MYFISNLQIQAQLLTKDISARFAAEYLHVIAYIGVAAVLNAVLFGDDFNSILADIRRALLGNAIG